MEHLVLYVNVVVATFVGSGIGWVMADQIYKKGWDSLKADGWGLVLCLAGTEFHLIVVGEDWGGSLLGYALKADTFTFSVMFSSYIGTRIIDDLAWACHSRNFFYYSPK